MLSLIEVSENECKELLTPDNYRKYCLNGYSIFKTDLTCLSTFWIEYLQKSDDKMLPVLKIDNVGSKEELNKWIKEGDHYEK